ncbi:transcobalamin-1-like isoform X1 [Anarrhichthys ocellatus]|uniref:transcobalamin-1-like isoform X1 n=2 Tax=Anarrhichthys ocellatus TaxID=433405 RepID=UPI0012EE4653|nr:transcobalamin-1-like isoform X1 [Anarrhichthys ocellatus]
MIICITGHTARYIVSVSPQCTLFSSSSLVGVLSVLSDPPFLQPSKCQNAYSTLKAFSVLCERVCILALRRPCTGGFFHCMRLCRTTSLQLLTYSFVVFKALIAMGSQVAECAASMEAMRTDARSNTYHNPMGISQILPALQQKSYLAVKSKECLNEDDTLVLEPIDPVVVLPSESTLTVMVEVVASSGAAVVYSVDAPKGSSLLEALELLKGKNVGFTFEKESSLWGPFLSAVNGEQARQSDRRYWHLSSDGTALSQGVNDFKIEVAQKITIKNTSY